MVNQSVDKKIYTDKISQEGIDSKALLVCLIQYIPKLILFALAGAVLGSGLNLIMVLMTELKNPEFIAETEYYIEFAQGQLEAKNYYNDFTWNDVVATDEILGIAMADIGSEYDRSQIKNMITADILSDVRYLTITVKGADKKLVGNVSKALEYALEGFGKLKKEFDSIYKIEDLGVQKEKVNFFTWRAAFLGAMLAVILFLFLRVFKFSMGDTFYTKRDVANYLDIDVYGLLYKNENKIECMQEKMLIACLNKALLDKENVYLLDMSGDCYGKFIAEIEKLDSKNTLSSKFELMSEVNSNKTMDIIILIPFGKKIREKTSDIIACVQQLNYNILGAVLMDVDKGFARLYYGE